MGGVEAPDPIRLPNPKTRFRATAERFEALAGGHRMSDWLGFMAALSRAQHAAAVSLAPAAQLTEEQILQRVRLHKPPLAADTHVRAPAWRDGLEIVLRSLERYAMPQGASDAMDALRASDASEMEALAGQFLGGSLDADKALPALFVAAALQVYFTLAASLIGPALLRLLPERGACPCCGSPPVSGVIMASGPTPGVRYLYCSLCSTAWNHVRAVCITCEGAGAISLRGIEGDNGAVKAEVCRDCQTYAKMLYQAKDMQIDPFADDLASLGLDMMVSEAGWARHAPNPLLLLGSR